MTRDEKVLADIQTEVQHLPKVQHVAVVGYAKTLRVLLRRGGAEAQMALALVGAELAVGEGRHA